VRVGDQELVEAQHRLGRAVSEFRFEYDLGGVTEAYDVSSDGVEQTFVIVERPAAAEALEVVGAVTTPLRCEPRAAAHLPLRFADPDDLLTVEYGAATAIDADGLRFPMTSAWDGERIRLRLGAADVARARFPLVVDPVLLNWSNVETVGVVDVDSHRLDTKWVAYTRVASSGDHDVYLRRYDDFWRNGTVPFADITSATSTDGVAVAACKPYFRPEPNAYLAYEQRTATKTEIAIVWGFDGRLIQQITATANEHLRNPSMAGNGLRASVALAYDRTFLSTRTVRARVLDEVPSGGHRVTTLAPAVATTGEEVSPQVVRAGVASWLVCWCDNAATASSIRSREIRYTSGFDPRPFLASSSSEHWRSGSYTCDDLRATEFVSTATFSFVRTPRRFGVRSLRVLALETSANGGVLFERSLHSGLGYENGAIARDGDWPDIVTACFTTFEGLTRTVRYVRLGADGAVATTWIDTSADLPRAPDLDYAPRPAGSPAAAGEFVAVWATGASDHPLYGQDLNYSSAAFLPLPIRGSVDCAQIDETPAFTEPALAGHSGYRIYLLGAGPLSVILLGVQSAAVPLDGLGMTGCQMGLVPIVTLPAIGGVDVPLPTDSYGGQLLVQWVLAAAGTNPLGLVTTDTMLVRVR
jgi:hypothetical protein